MFHSLISVDNSAKGPLFQSPSSMPEHSQMTNEPPCVKDEFQSTTPVPPHHMKGLIASNCIFKILNSSIKKPIYMN